MGIPVGDVLRAFVKGGWFRRILDFFKGTKVNLGGTEIDLNQGNTVSPPCESSFDSTPHQPGPSFPVRPPLRFVGKDKK